MIMGLSKDKYETIYKNTHDVSNINFRFEFEDGDVTNTKLIKLDSDSSMATVTDGERTQVIAFGKDWYIIDKPIKYYLGTSYKATVS